MVDVRALGYPSSSDPSGPARSAQAPPPDRTTPAAGAGMAVQVESVEGLARDQRPSGAGLRYNG
jgi:hypothetical protein